MKIFLVCRMFGVFLVVVFINFFHVSVVLPAARPPAPQTSGQSQQVKKPVPVSQAPAQPRAASGVGQALDPAAIHKIVEEHLGTLGATVDSTCAEINGAVRLVNRVSPIASVALGLVIDSRKIIKETEVSFKEAEKSLNGLKAGMTTLTDQIHSAMTDLNRVAQTSAAELKSTAAQERLKAEDIATKTADAIAGKMHEPLEDKIKVAQIAAKTLAEEAGKWIRGVIDDHKLMAKIALAIIITAFFIYCLKYGIPQFINYLTKPHIITETSMSWWGKPTQMIKIEDLVFSPYLQKQVWDLFLRIQSSKKYDEPLPNVLFHGPSGSGKTATAKAIAYSSGLDFILTSGSEFAKITDLNEANNELRKLLKLAEKSKKGAIVFIDEAESLFANRKLLTTSKLTQDFINTFLSLISDQSQKKIMFVFATNHPFKLDDAITNRIGINIEFTLPEACERDRILFTYLVNFAQDNEKIVVGMHPDVLQKLPGYAQSLEGFSPRAIKFIAQEMVIRARRQEDMQITSDIAQAVIDEAKNGLQKTMQWEKERIEWVSVK